MTDIVSSRHRFGRWLTSQPDEFFLRLVLRAVIGAAVAALALDLAGMTGLLPTNQTATAPIDGSPSPAILDVPAILSPLLPGGDRRGVPMPKFDAALSKPMSFELLGAGKLMATGTITPGVSATFAAEIAKRGDYVKTVVLNSPGGSVSDALAMGRLIRERKLATEVEDGKLCASSCPLVMFGGVERRVGRRAAIGVHQVFAATTSTAGELRDGMGEAQVISARCQRYLLDMGIDLQTWVHAMETPKERLYLFKAEELRGLKIITSALNADP